MMNRLHPTSWVRGAHENLHDYLLRDVNCANKNKQIHTKKSPKNHITTPTAKKYDRTLPSNAFWPFFGCGKSAEYWGLRFSLDKKNHTQNRIKNTCSANSFHQNDQSEGCKFGPDIYIHRYHLWRFACFRPCFYRGQIYNMNMAVSTSLTTQGHFGRQNWPVREHKLQRYKHIDMRWTIPTWWLSHVTPTWRKPWVFSGNEWNGWKGCGFRTTKKNNDTWKIRCETEKRTSNKTLPASILSYYHGCHLVLREKMWWKSIHFIDQSSPNVKVMCASCTQTTYLKRHS